jgi:hypothetical protein
LPLGALAASAAATRTHARAIGRRRRHRRRGRPRSAGGRPPFLVGERFADALDDDESNGVFALGLVLGVGGPALLATLVAWRQVKRPVAIALGLAGGAVSVAVLFAAFLIYCSAVDCIV